MILEPFGGQLAAPSSQPMPKRGVSHTTRRNELRQQMIDWLVMETLDATMRKLAEFSSM